MSERILHLVAILRSMHLLELLLIYERALQSFCQETWPISISNAS